MAVRGFSSKSDDSSSSSVAQVLEDNPLQQTVKGELDPSKHVITEIRNGHEFFTTPPLPVAPENPMGPVWGWNAPTEWDANGIPVLNAVEQAAVDAAVEEAKTFKKMDEYYDRDGLLYRNYPAISKDPALKAFQREIFHVGDPFQTHLTGQKLFTWAMYEKKYTDWYMPNIRIEQKIRKKLAMDAIAEAGDTPTAESLMAKIELELCKTDILRERRLKKIADDRKRGKGKPKKGMGKRSQRRT